MDDVIYLISKKKKNILLNIIDNTFILLMYCYIL